MQILILLGGHSAERDVSFVTGVAVARALASSGHQVTGCDPSTGTWFEGTDWFTADRHIDRAPPAIGNEASAAETMTAVLSDTRVATFDVVFLGLHGGAGEDGTVQTLLGLAGATYTGSGPLSSGVAMHKVTSKRLFLQAGIPTPRWVFPAGEPARLIEQLGLPLIVKPVAEGSTVGLTLVKESGDLADALTRAGADPLVETFIPGREISVGILGGRTLPAVESIPEHEIYDYECKYTDGKTQYRCPAPMDPAVAQRVHDLAGRAFDALGCAGYARADFRLAEDGEAYCLEVNTLPGMTSHSLVPMAAQAEGIDFPTLCETICRLAVEKPRVPMHTT